MQRADIAGTIDFEPVGIFRSQRLDDRVDFADEIRQFDVLKIEFQLAGFDLGQIENVADQAQQMAAGVLDLVEVAGEVREPVFLGLFVQHFAVADNGIERRAQLVAHVGEEDRLGAVGGIGIDHGLFEVGLAFFELADIGEYTDGAAVGRASFADAGPDVVVAVFGKSVRIGMLRLALGDPLIRRAPGQIDQPAIDDGAKDGRERRPRHQDIPELGIQLLELVVAEDEPVLWIVQDKAIRNGFDRGRDHASLAIGLVGEPLALDDAFTKQPERLGHRADLATGVPGDRGLQVAGGDAVHRRNNVAQWNEDRAEHHQRDDHAEHDRHRHDQIADLRGMSDIGNHLLAGGCDPHVEIVDQSFDAIVDDDAVLARFGDRGVGNHALIVGVLFDGAHRELLVLANLSLQHRGDFGPPLLEIVEPLHQPLARGVCADLRLTKQADGKIGEPVAVFAEIVADRLRRVDQFGKLGVARHRLRTVSELGRQEIRRRHDHGDQDARQEQQPGSDAEVGQHLGALSDLTAHQR